MHPQKTPAALRKRLFLFFVLFLAAVLLLTGMFALSIAQSPEERELEDKIPKHLPIKVKIKKEKEKAFKDLKNEKWLRDFELEVTNTGDKPIYFLDLTVVLPEITAPNGYTVMFGLHYGRIALGDIKTKAEPDDVPIKPGETHVFSLTHKQEAWEVFKAKKNWQQPKKLRVKFQIMSFGDGTGFWGNEGMAVPRPPNEQSSTGRCMEKPSKNVPHTIDWPRTFPSHQAVTSLMDILPTSFWSANFCLLNCHILLLPSQICSRISVARTQIAFIPRPTLNTVVIVAEFKRGLQEHFAPTHMELAETLIMAQTFV